MKKIEKALLLLQVIAIILILLSHLIPTVTDIADLTEIDSTHYLFAFITGIICCALKFYFIRNSRDDQKNWDNFRILDLAILLVYIGVYSFNTALVILVPFALIFSQQDASHKRNDIYTKLSILILLANLVLRTALDSISLFGIIQIVIVIPSLYFSSRLNTKMLDKQRENLQELSIANEKLNRKVAEFFNLQHVQTAIKSIHNTDELLNTVNDTIIGIVGPNYSSIVLYKKDNDNKEEGVFELGATNIKEAAQEDFIEHDCPILWSIMNEEGLVDNVNDKIRFSDEKIASFMIVPLMVKHEPIGMIVVTQYLQSGLNYEHLRIIRFVAADLSVALENTGLYEKMEKMATMDGLTMVYNRMYFKTALEDEFEKAKNNYPISVAICDADDFKKINDKYGHIFGDYVLKSIADRLKARIRTNDIIARYGGEEFVILLPKCSAQIAYKVVDRLRESISNDPIKDKNHSAKVTVSFGVATYPANGLYATDVLRAADNALYQAKRAGKNCTRQAEVIIENPS